MVGYEMTDDVRVVAKICSSYWRSLPMHAKAYIDVDDMIQGALETVIAKVDRYTPERGAASTFAATLARNYCINLINSYEQQKRKAEDYGMVPIEDWSGGAIDCDMLSWLAHKKAIERLVNDASDDLQVALDLLLNHRRVCFKERDVDELRRLVEINGIQRSDFDVVMSVV